MKKISILGLSLVFATSVFGQTNILNMSIPEEIGLKTEAQMQLADDKPLEYGYVDDRDILYSKIVWEKIVLDEKVNFPYLFHQSTKLILIFTDVHYLLHYGKL